MQLINKTKTGLVAIVSDKPLLLLMCLATAYFGLYYLTDPTRPAGMFTWLFGYADTAQYPMGWAGYYDQGQYLRMARTLADFDFANFGAAYTYGLGYPVVAVPALWLGLSTDPFVLFNLATFLFATFAVYTAAKKLFSPVAGLLAGFGLVFATPLINYTALPWNSTVCLFAISTVLLLLTVEKIRPWRAVTIGFMAGWVFAARYVDILWFLPIATAALYRGSLKNLIKLGLVASLGALIWLVPVAYSHNAVFGSPFRSPYVVHTRETDDYNDQQLGSYKLSRIPDAATGMFLGPRLEGSKDNDRGMLVLMFWIVAAVPGLFVALKTVKQRKIFFITFATMVVISHLFYLSFRASGPDSLKYGILHYFKMFWPGFVLLAAAYFDSLFSLQKRPDKTKS